MDESPPDTKKKIRWAMYEMPASYSLPLGKLIVTVVGFIVFALIKFFLGKGV